MAIQVKRRNGTASAWTSTNPVLNQGEIGVETDTGGFKIGNGSTAWAGLAYQGSTGPSQTKPYRSFGDGSDGDVTISSGTTILARDMYYNNLTINGTGSLVTNGCKVFVKGILDLTSAPTNAINWNGNSGGNASGATGGAAATAQPGVTLGSMGAAGAGANATTGVGVAGGAAAALTGNGGASSGQSGAGGLGQSGAGGGATGIPVLTSLYMKQFLYNFSRGVTLLSGGVSGAGGASGAGDSFFSSVGGGGGGGGNGGGIIVLYVNILLKGSSTAIGAISSVGGNGGNGADGAPTLGSDGGGGGGAGGAGGCIIIYYNILAGSNAVKAIDISGGTGGNGGNGVGAQGTARGGQGGGGGCAGRLYLFNVPSCSTELFVGNNIPSALNTSNPEQFGNQSLGSNGGNGGTAQQLQIDL